MHPASDALPFVLALTAAQAAPVHVGPGCLRRDLPSTGNARTWLVEMAPGSEWPWTDHHDAPELVYILEGEVIEDGQHFGSGTYFLFPKGSSHRPRTDTGVRMFGVNL